MRPLLFIFLLFPFLGRSQNGPSDSVWLNKSHYKYIGIQSNMLLQQFISFNSNASINSNPYLFTYSKINTRTGKGYSMGTGFSVSENSSNDGVSSITVSNANVTIRNGFEKRYLQREKFIPFWGIELGAGAIYNRTTSRLFQTVTNNITTVETTRYFFGPSFHGGLNYCITRHILVGTEFYFNLQAAVTNTSTTGFGFTQDFVPFNVGFQVPTALFLIFRY